MNTNQLECNLAHWNKSYLVLIWLIVAGHILKEVNNPQISWQIPSTGLTTPLADEALYYSIIYPNSRDLGTAE